MKRWRLLEKKRKQEAIKEQCKNDEFKVLVINGIDILHDIALIESENK